MDKYVNTLMSTVDAVRQAQNVVDLKIAFSQGIEVFGFKQFIYGVFLGQDAAGAPVPDLDRTIYTYPDAWIIKYLNSNYLQIDPVIERVVTEKNDVFLWPDDLAPSPMNEQFLKDANQYSLARGVTIPMRCASEEVRSVTFATSQTNQDFEAFLSYAGDRATLFAFCKALSVAFHQRLLQVDETYRVPLNQTEMVVANLINLGLTTRECAQVVRKNENTTKSIYAKLRARLALPSAPSVAFLMSSMNTQGTFKKNKS